MNPYVIYQIVRFGVPSSAGLFQPDGSFSQIFPSRRIFRDKTAWTRAWYIFGDEEIVMYVRPRAAPVNIH